MAGFFILSLSILASFLSVLQPSTANPVCQGSYGDAIDYDHCIEALGALQVHLLGPGQSSPVQSFSRQANLARKLQHMPQAFAWKTCSVGIDLADPVPPVGTVSSDWGTLGDHLLQLLQTCVQRQGTGGRLVVDGFDIVVISPAASIGHGTCLVPPRQYSMSLGRCIDQRAQGKERWALARMRRPAAPPDGGRDAPGFLQSETTQPSMGRKMPPLPPVVQQGYPQGPPAARPPHSQTYPPLAALDQLSLGRTRSPQQQPFAPPQPVANMVQPAVARPYLNQALQPRPGGQYGSPQLQEHLPPVNPPPVRLPLTRPRPPPRPPPRVMRHQYLVQGQPNPPQAAALVQAPPPDSSSTWPPQNTPASEPASIPTPKGY
jgi:hypothetical protein